LARSHKAQHLWSRWHPGTVKKPGFQTAKYLARHPVGKTIKKGSGEFAWVWMETVFDPERHRPVF